MVIAIPEAQGRVSPVLDVASLLRWVRFEGRTEQDRREIRLAPCLPWELARSLAELEVDVLICAGVSALVEDGLRRAGIRVVSQICGPVDDVLAAFQSGRLGDPKFRMPGCWSLHRRRIGPQRSPRPTAQTTGQATKRSSARLRRGSQPPRPSS